LVSPGSTLDLQNKVQVMTNPSYTSLARFSPEKMVKVNLFESHRMFADLYCMMPGQEQKPHIHRESDKIYFVLEGRGTFTVGDEASELGPGESCVARAGEPHGVRNDSTENAVLLVFMAPHPGFQ
jgi:mannose-6-phosphate isomerase-like protein (cupin superfamily)